MQASFSCMCKKKLQCIALRRISAMTWNDIDKRLEALGKDRRWLADAAGYTYDTIRNTLAPNASKRSDRMLSVLSRAIEDEEERQATPTSKGIRPGVFEIFQTEAQLHTADLASRIVGAPSLAEFCRDVIIAESEHIIAKEAHSTGCNAPPNPVQSLRVAEDPPSQPDKE
jgi:hypothetical protein